MRKRQLMMPLAGLALTAGTLLSMGLTAGPASAATTGCPATKAGVPVASNVAASQVTVGHQTTYTFTSLANQNPSGGVPGLIKFCVYPTLPTSDPTGHNVDAVGDNNAKWVYNAGGSNNFAFARPGGNPSNIGLDGHTHAIGTATWGTDVPNSQAIVLHISDSTTCASLYGVGTSPTCFVRPNPHPGPDCTHGDMNVAYNALPFGVENCVNPAIGFEAQGASEFGNSVNLAGDTTTPGRNLSQLKVDFQSFACQSGHWNGVPGDNTTPVPCGKGDLVTPAGMSPGTFDWPITANIYAANPDGSPGALLTSVTQTKTIPYRPAADTTGNCTGPSGATDAANRWWNPAAAGGGHCQSSIAKVLTFNFPVGTVLPDHVVWTVAFNTSDYGAIPQSPQACNSASDPNFPGLTDGGCPYDSLNVGDNGNHGGAAFPSSFIDNAPYGPGTDSLPGGGAVINQYGSGLHLESSGPAAPAPAGWDGLRPLGEIITAP
jgi:hypothetical protein